MSVEVDFFSHHVYQMETLEILLEGSNVTEHHVGFLLIFNYKRTTRNVPNVLQGNNSQKGTIT